MNFTRTQRNRLEELSTELFNNASRWQKVLKDPNLQVLERVEEVPVTRQFIEVKKGKFQCVNLPKDKQKDKDGKPLTQQRPVYRQMNFEELEMALVAALEMKNFAELHKQGESLLYEELVKRYKNGTIMNRPFLIVPETGKADFDDIFKDLPEDQKGVLQPYVVPNANPNVFSVDGLKFVTELTYQNTYLNPDGTKKENMD